MKSKQVLIIDDEKGIRDVLAMCLREFAGWDVVTADSGLTGLAELTRAKPDAILLDVVMPEMDGLTFLHQMQANPDYEAVPVVLLTAKVSLTVSSQLLSMGVVGAISKPFNPLLLSDQLATLLHWDYQAALS